MTPEPLISVSAASTSAVFAACVSTTTGTGSFPTLPAFCEAAEIETACLPRI